MSFSFSTKVLVASGNFQFRIRTHTQTSLCSNYCHEPCNLDLNLRPFFLDSPTINARDHSSLVRPSGNPLPSISAASPVNREVNGLRSRQFYALLMLCMVAALVLVGWCTPIPGVHHSATARLSIVGLDEGAINQFVTLLSNAGLESLFVVQRARPLEICGRSNDLIVICFPLSEDIFRQPDSISSVGFGRDLALDQTPQVQEFFRKLSSFHNVWMCYVSPALAISDQAREEVSFTLHHQQLTDPFVSQLWRGKRVFIINSDLPVSLREQLSAPMEDAQMQITVPILLVLILVAIVITIGVILIALL